MRVLRRVVIVATLVAGTVAVPATSAARGGMTGSNPADQAILAAAPAIVELTFSNPPDVGLAHVSVADGSGSQVNSGALSGGAGRSLRQPVSIRTTGDVTVIYHVPLRGGGTVQGVIRFSVGTGLPPAPVAAAATPPAGHGHGVDPLSAVLLVLDGLVALGVVVLLLRKPRLPATPPDQPRLGLARRARGRPASDAD